MNVFAFIVTGIRKGNIKKANILALGNINKYAPMKAETIPDAPTIGIVLEGFNKACP